MTTRGQKIVLLAGLAWCLILAAGCGIHMGYAPQTVNVYRGDAHGPVPAVPDSLKVVSWNIQFGEQVPLAIKEMAANPDLADADILLVQEMTSEGMRQLAEALGMYQVYGAAAVHPHHHKMFGNGVLSKWPIVADKAIILPYDTPITGHHRIAVAADIDLGGQVIRMISIHTATMVVDQDKRLEQVKAARDSLGTFDGPVLIGGDFNTVSDYEVTLLKQAMRRLRLKPVRLPPGPTIRNKFKKLPGSVPVLDHFFCRDFVEGSRGIADGTTASDHYPIWAVLAIPPAPAEIE